MKAKVRTFKIPPTVRSMHSERQGRELDEERVSLIRKIEILPAAMQECLNNDPVARGAACDP